MQKIYMVVADNGLYYEDHSWWNERAFTSKDSAEKFIETFTAEILAAIERETELEELFYERSGESYKDWESYDEYEEYERVHDLASEYWHFFDEGGFRIEEYELYD